MPYAQSRPSHKRGRFEVAHGSVPHATHFEHLGSGQSPSVRSSFPISLLIHANVEHFPCVGSAQWFSFILGPGIFKLFHTSIIAFPSTPLIRSSFVYCVFTYNRNIQDEYRLQYHNIAQREDTLARTEPSVREAHHLLSYIHLTSPAEQWFCFLPGPFGRYLRLQSQWPSRPSRPWGCGPQPPIPRPTVSLFHLRDHSEWLSPPPARPHTLHCGICPLPSRCYFRRRPS